MLWLSLHLPLLPLQIVNHVGAEPPSALAISEHHRVLLANERARQHGIEAGTDCNTATALCPGLQLIERNLEKEQQVLQHLAESCYSFSSIVVPHTNNHQQHSVLLEVGRSIKLFKTLGNLLNAIHYCFTHHPLGNNGFVHYLQLAKTPKAAELLARHQYYQVQRGKQAISYDSASINLEHIGDEALHDTPLELLDYAPATLKQCRDLGLHQLGELLALPATALRKRFSSCFIEHLDQLAGKQPDPQQGITLPPSFRRELHYIDGLRSHNDLSRPIDALLREFCRYLRDRQQKCQSISWVFQRFSKKQDRITLAFSKAQYQLDNFLNLSLLKLNELPLDSPVESISLEADCFIALTDPERDLFEQTTSVVEDQIITDILATKIAPQHLSKLQHYSEHLPELSNRPASLQPQHAIDPLFSGRAGYLSCSSSHSGLAIQHNDELHDTAAERPYWMLEHPEPLQRIDQVVYRKKTPLKLLKGPERIEGYWWQQTICRDYFIAGECARPEAGHQAKHGEHSDMQQAFTAFYWIYYNRQDQKWYLHGLF